MPALTRLNPTFTHTVVKFLAKLELGEKRGRLGREKKNEKKKERTTGRQTERKTETRREQRFHSVLPIETSWMNQY